MAKGRDWYRLDNAAKLIPSTTVGADTRVFRICCELNEDVDPEVLQSALDQTMEEYPHYLCCLRKGLFWYYLDAVNKRPEVYEDNLPPMKALYIPGRRNLLFRVNYYRNRINLEMFHVLSDGTGAFTFLRALVQNYLVEKHHLNKKDFASDLSSVDEKTDDAFNHFYEKEKEPQKRNWLKEMFPEKAFPLKGTPDVNLQEHVIEGTVSLKQMLQVAHEKKVTIGELATAVFIEAIIKQMTVREKKMPIVVSVPVNLRQYFPSLTTRNFFGVIPVQYRAEHYDGTLESILSDVRSEFQKHLTKDAIRRTMNSYAALEHNFVVKMVPLLFKDLGLQAIAHMMNRGISTTVSNVGRVEMPEGLVPYIRKFSSFMSCRTTQMCISTFQDNLVFGITTCYTIHKLPLCFFRRLVGLGLDVEIETNDYNVEGG